MAVIHPAVWMTYKDINMTKIILHATDLSKDHYPISLRAKAFADELNATLHLIHVIELPASIVIAQSLGFAELGRPCKDDAEAVLKLLGESLNIPEDRQYVEIGSASDEIIKKCEKIKANLLFIGNHSPQNPFAITGSTVHSSLRHAPCDVLVLKP